MGRQRKHAMMHSSQYAHSAKKKHICVNYTRELKDIENT